MESKIKKVGGYKCSDGKILVPGPKESDAAFKERVRGHEIGALMRKELEETLSFPLTVSTLIINRNLIANILDTKQYKVKI